MSFFRSVIREAVLVELADVPVRSQPSGVSTAAVASGSEVPLEDRLASG